MRLPCTVTAVRLSPDEKEEIRKSAALAGCTVSEYIRKRALKQKIITCADQATVGELLRLGGLLKHAISLKGDDHEIRKSILQTLDCVKQAAKALHEYAQ